MFSYNFDVKTFMTHFTDVPGKKLGRFGVDKDLDQVYPLSTDETKRSIESATSYLGETLGKPLANFAIRATESGTRLLTGSSHRDVTFRLEVLAAQILLNNRTSSEEALNKIQKVYDEAFKREFEGMNSQEGLINWKTTALFGGESDKYIERRHKKEQEAREKAQEAALSQSTTQIEQLRETALKDVEETLRLLNGTIEGAAEMQSYYENLYGKSDAVGHFHVAIECLNEAKETLEERKVALSKQ